MQNQLPNYIICTPGQQATNTDTSRIWKNSQDRDQALLVDEDRIKRRHSLMHFGHTRIKDFTSTSAKYHVN